MKTIILSALLIAVATAAHAQSRNNTMGGWGNGSQSSNIGSGRSGNYAPPSTYQGGSGYQTTTPGNGYGGAYGTGGTRRYR